MFYVEVLVAEATYHGSEPLTYGSVTRLPIGSVVLAPLKSKQVLGIVVGEPRKPSFPVKQSTPIEGLPPIPIQMLKLLDWIRDYYPSPLGVITQQFLPKAIPKKLVEPPTTAMPQSILPPLTIDQEKALQNICHSGVHLLHGQTGTGKTRVYVELAKRSMAADKSSIILTPEIGLTSQLARGFSTTFGRRVIVMHSRLTNVTRQRLWVQLLLQKEPVIVIGPRSALFCPLRNIGLIVVDESHENTYKQDQAPYYHATTVAAKYASLHNATIVLGSATPLVTDYFLAKQKNRPIIEMAQIASNKEAGKVDIDVVDLRDHSKFSKKPYLSDKLLREITNTLNRQEQVLLFLNRRGTARIIMCDQCGWQAVCPHCDLPLVYHGDTHIARCHSCSFKAPSPTTCNVCDNASVIFKSIGTKAIVEEITSLYPEAIVKRYDTDNKKSERIEQNYDDIVSGKIQILVGTQAIAKGLDLPKLGLVGVVVADTSLYLPDFSAQERTYQLLSQVIGRVGRGHCNGRVVIQTYIPGSPALRSILNRNWQEFYEKELEERRIFLFPPFCFTLKLYCRRASQQSAQKAANSLADALRGNPRIIIEGPAPAFREKVQNKFEWQIIVKSKNRRFLIEVIKTLPSGWQYDIDPTNLL
jgi:primosomal protein N' (replication factor Y) (superfamily II helicase)